MSKERDVAGQRCSKCGHVWGSELRPGWMFAEYDVKDHESDVECQAVKKERREKQTVR